MRFEKRAPPVTPLPPKPLEVPATGEYDGDDGKWSSFHINIGNDGTGTGQNFRVLISTSSGTTVVPSQADWCNLECAKERGVQVFNGSPSGGLATNISKTWDQTGNYYIPLPDWFTANLTLDPSGRLPVGTFGKDYVTPGPSTASVRKSSKQFVVAYAGKDFYMGWLGLAVGQTSLTNGSLPNFLETLVGSEDPVIPSRSFGYSAGAHYRNSQRGVPGSLVLGGFDSSRYIGTGVSMNMPSAIDNTLVVGVQSLSYEVDPEVAMYGRSFTTNDQRSEGGFLADIDSTIPYLILPNDICGFFAEEFQLTYDEDMRYYLVNDSAHARNIEQNPTVYFKIGDGTQDNALASVSIALPYAAFDWQLAPPKANQTTQYFPIRRADGGKSVLGRTFLQEAYLIVDYEHMNFTVARAALDDMPRSHIISIHPEGYVPPSSDDGDAGSGGLAAGAVAGIVIGIVVALSVAGIAVFLYLRRHRHAKKNDPDREESSEIDTTYADNEGKYRRVSELTGSEIQSPKDSPAGFYSNDQKSFPPISEMSPDSTPAELYSPPVDGRDTFDYFVAGRVRRRGATRDRDSSGHNTPRTPIAELSGEDSIRPAANGNRSTSDVPPATNIDEVLTNKRSSNVKASTEVTNSTAKPGESATINEINQAKVDASVDAGPTGDEQGQQSTTERRPSHTRGLSDITMQSDSTAVSQPTPEELEHWARSGEEGPRRPMSP
ncbi:hypothetical protein J1614_003148 [Plenodomus biglobosus]|nr:hypothetical protein J1614_003148 [Plenodomus biglobosus]